MIMNSMYYNMIPEVGMRSRNSNHTSHRFSENMTLKLPILIFFLFTESEDIRPLLNQMQGGYYEQALHNMSAMVGQQHCHLPSRSVSKLISLSLHINPYTSTYTHCLFTTPAGNRLHGKLHIHPGLQTWKKIQESTKYKLPSTHPQRHWLESESHSSVPCFWGVRSFNNT